MAKVKIRNKASHVTRMFKRGLTPEPVDFTDGIASVEEAVADALIKFDPDHFELVSKPKATKKSSAKDEHTEEEAVNGDS